MEGPWMVMESHGMVELGGAHKGHGRSMDGHGKSWKGGARRRSQPSCVLRTTAACASMRIEEGSNSTSEPSERSTAQEEERATGASASAGVGKIEGFGKKRGLARVG